MCQSGEALFHCTMSSGVVQAFQTAATGERTRVSTVISMGQSFQVRGNGAGQGTRGQGFDILPPG